MLIIFIQEQEDVKRKKREEAQQFKQKRKQEEERRIKAVEIRKQTAENMKKAKLFYESKLVIKVFNFGFKKLIELKSLNIYL